MSELPSPPRVLFVVGASLGDEFIRPGAEYLGLLRSLAQSNLPLYTHLLLEANPDSLEAAVENFRPNIVHFTCHGVTGADNRPALSLQAKSTASGTIEVNADQLCELLRTAKNLPLPQVVVLNACSTATSQQNEIGPPLVVELVKNRIPVVVGMAGDVADMACRLFTRGFYRALLEGDEIALAAARGRRAAIAYGGYIPANTLDWGLPALCLSDGVGEARLQLHVQDERLKRLQQASEFSIRPSFPAFCDRLDMLQVYDQLMRSSEKQYLVISVPQADQTNPNETRPQFGRTRLLKEMAAQAVRDGHVPVLLSTRWLDQLGWPDQIAGFYGMVIQAVNKTLRILRGIPGLETLAWSGARLRYLMAPGAAPPPGLGHEFSDSLLGDPQGQGPLAGAVALRLDLMELLAAVRQKLPSEEAAAARLLLLIDDLHQVKYIENILAILDLDGLRDPTVNTDVRGVLTYSNRPVIGQEISVKKIDYWINAGYVHLETFKLLHGELTSDKPDEFHRAAMIYRHFLLHWQVDGVEQRLALAPPLSNTPAAVVVKGLANLVKGYPSNLDDLMVRVKIESYREINDQVLRPADDEAALKNLQDNLRKR